MSQSVAAIGEAARPGLARILTATLVALDVNLLVHVYPGVGRWWICCPVIVLLGVGMALIPRAFPRGWPFVFAAGTFGNLLLFTGFIFDEHLMRAPGSPVLLLVLSGAAAAICMGGLPRPRLAEHERPISILAALLLIGLMAAVVSGGLQVAEVLTEGVDFLVTLLLVVALAVALLQRIR